jgi:hypothetical protein
MKDTLELINQMQADGVIDRYAIGEAVGATFYLEPAATLDIDIFVVRPTAPESAILTVVPIYEYLTSRGCLVEREHIIVGSWPVQFLPAHTGLEKEALLEAVQTEVEGVRTWVMRAEHLVALALRTGRAKDYARIIQFVESGTVDTDRLKTVLARFQLLRAWDQFRRKYLEK